MQLSQRIGDVRAKLERVVTERQPQGNAAGQQRQAQERKREPCQARQSKLTSVQGRSMRVGYGALAGYARCTRHATSLSPRPCRRASPTIISLPQLLTIL